MNGCMKLLVLIILFFCQVIFPDNYNNVYKFEKVAFSDELPQVSIPSILQNKQGYMWFATSGGLVKYDGYKIKVYTYTPGNLNSLSSSGINTIYEDSKGFIWIGSKGGGLDRFDPVTGSFIHFKAQPNTPHSLSTNYITYMKKSSNR